MEHQVHQSQVRQSPVHQSLVLQILDLQILHSHQGWLQIAQQCFAHCCHLDIYQGMDRQLQEPEVSHPRAAVASASVAEVAHTAWMLAVGHRDSAVAAFAACLALTCLAAAAALGLLAVVGTGLAGNLVGFAGRPAALAGMETGLKDLAGSSAYVEEAAAAVAVAAATMASACLACSACSAAPLLALHQHCLSVSDLSASSGRAQPRRSGGQPRSSSPRIGCHARPPAGCH
mmetsp:Transcript_74391/g.138930  ORF Transcript_74391/g.138930 Transcript_74391/m.138930 type:complete len:231 (+) Transcript_74391:194-886(+)